YAADTGGIFTGGNGKGISMMMRNRTQELKLVFALDNEVNPTEFPLGTVNVKLERKAPSIRPGAALELLVERMSDLGLNATFIERGK
ncbi:hypothetical protein, partial [Burkholderia sp. SIMBA_048]|uniref:hypothetical protein n=1 Tax=Burkholderia sp. SIMBA_048 TaxID=3085789 RepID=UPI00397CD5AA